MKFQPDRSDAQTIHGYGPGWIGVDGEKHTHELDRGLERAPAAVELLAL